MEVNHPFAGARKALVIPAEVAAYVASLKPLPTKVYDLGYTKKYWADMGLGDVPAGVYTDPEGAGVAQAVEGLYHHLKGAKITRHRVAVALNLRSADDVDAIRAGLYGAGAGVSRGRPGVSVNSIDATKWVNVLEAQASKKKAVKAKVA